MPGSDLTRPCSLLYRAAPSLNGAMSHDSTTSSKTPHNEKEKLSNSSRFVLSRRYQTSHEPAPRKRISHRVHNQSSPPKAPTLQAAGNEPPAPQPLSPFNSPNITPSHTCTSHSLATFSKAQSINRTISTTLCRKKSSADYEYLSYTRNNLTHTHSPARPPPPTLHRPK